MKNPAPNKGSRVEPWSLILGENYQVNIFTSLFSKKAPGHRGLLHTVYKDALAGQTGRDSLSKYG
jgi:hypothetical protein